MKKILPSSLPPSLPPLSSLPPFFFLPFARQALYHLRCSTSLFFLMKSVLRLMPFALPFFHAVFASLWD
jgi:hypothetical protein